MKKFQIEYSTYSTHTNSYVYVNAANIDDAKNKLPSSAKKLISIKTIN